MSYCLTSNVSNLVVNIFSFREATFVSAIKPTFPNIGDRETLEQTLKITNISATMPLRLAKASILIAKYLIY
jgi:hypothetical protein